MTEETKNHIARIGMGVIILGCFLLSGFSGAASVFGPYVLTAPIAIDGDTIRGDINIWPDLNVDASIRIAGVDTPELKASLACERALAVTAKKFTDNWILANQPLTVSQVKSDKYASRYDAIVTGSRGDSLAGALIASGVGRPYSGGTRQPWCQ